MASSLDNSLLITACSQGNYSEVKKLIDLGYDVNFVNNGSDTPLSVATIRSHVDIVKLLIQKGANVHFKTSYGTSIFSMAIHHAYPSKKVELMKIFIQKGVDINGMHGYGKITPLQEAVKIGHIEAVELLIQHRAYGFSQKPHQPPLFESMHRRKYEITKLLIKHRYNLNEVDLDGDPALTLALKQHNTEIAKLLIEAGVDLYQASSYGDSPFIRACYENNHEIIELLVEKGVDVNRTDNNKVIPLIYAINRKNTYLVDFLISKDADINVCDWMGYYPLHLAVSEFSLDIMDILIKAGIDLNQRIKNTFKTALMVSIQHYKYPAIIKLVTAGANLHLENNEGENALTMAIRRNNLRMVNILIEAGADINYEDKNGFTPLSLSISLLFDDISIYLINHGAKLDVISKDGFTLIHRLFAKYNRLSTLMTLYLTKYWNIESESDEDNSVSKRQRIK